MSNAALFGFELLLDESLPEGCIKLEHGDGSADVFRVEGEHATRMVVSPTGKVFEPDSPGGRFWAESARRKRLEEEAAKAETPLGHFEAIMRMPWTTDNLVAAALKEPLRFGPQDLDEWLAEDNPHRLTHFGTPGVLEALGL